MPDEPGPPRWLWKVALLALTLALTGGLALSMAIGAGWNNPRPPDPPDWRLPGPLLLQAAPPDGRAVRFLDRPAESFTLEAAAGSLPRGPEIEMAPWSGRLQSGPEMN
ncbi:MAG TPA: hypothetical protein EYP77_06075 [Anaerolineae bacterium]|nr:hypothetical protein [Anaerolineae bacterium]